MNNLILKHDCKDLSALWNIEVLNVVRIVASVAIIVYCFAVT